MSTTTSFSAEQKPKKQINLIRRLLCDSIAGLGAALTVTPIMKTVDISVTLGQSGKSTMFQGVQECVKTLIFTPHKFIFSKSFAWIFTVYGSTYIANNTIDSICKIYHINDLVPKLIGVTSVNMITSILKDAAFAKYYGTKPPGRVPLSSYIIWFIRDILSIAAAFIFPERLSRYMQTHKGYNKNSADKISQFACPVGLQTIFTPIHLLGLDFYNENVSKASERAKRIANNYPKALPLRVVRMAGAYGVGGLNNKAFRNSLHGRNEGKHWDSDY
jgi:hypothetical protein